MVHNISSDGLRLMKENAALYYGVNPEQIVVRHENLVLRVQGSEVELFFGTDNLYYLLDAQFIRFYPEPYDFTFRVSERYKSTKFDVASFNYEDYEADKLNDFKEKNFYFNQFYMVDNFGDKTITLSVLRFNII